MRKTKVFWNRCAAVAALSLSTISVVSSQDWGSSGITTDTAKVDSTASVADASGGGGWGATPGKDEQPKRAVYKRFVPPYDSMREIVYYEGIIEDEGEYPEKNGADSLYLRAKKFLMNRYGKDNMKKWTVEDKKADRLTLKLVIPMVVQSGPYTKGNSGMLEYKLTIRFKDGRYKYQFGNFVHIESPNGLGKEPTRTYHEYYMKVKRGYEFTDKYLLAGDREVHQIVEGLKKSLHEPYQPDEDDW
jgi:Domain of unknown function (DUF4468) with TBP-like fold